MAVQRDLALKGYQSIENSGVIGVGGLLELFSVGSLTNSGLIAAENSIGITLAYGDLTNSGGVLSGGSTAFQVGGSFFNTGVFTARQSLVGNVTKLLVNTTPDPWNIYTDPAAPETLPWDTFGPLPLAPEPAILSAGQDLRLTVGGDVLNQESTLSGGRSILLASGGSIINAGGRMMAGIGGSVIKGMTFTNTTAGGLIEEKDWDRYMVIYDDTKVYDTKIGGVPVLYRKNIGIMGYHRSRYFGGESGLLSAVGDLTVDVASGSNEASVIVSGGELNLLGLWENKSDYDVYSKSWLALDEGFAEIGGTTRERLEEGGHDHFGEVARRVHDGTVSIRDDTGTGENRLRVFKYAEDVLGIDPREHGGEDTGWVAMESVVVMGGISDRTYLRFHLIEDYQEDEVHRTAIIHGHQGTNVILLNDDYGTSWAGIGGALAEQPFVVDGPHTGLAPGTVTVGAVNAVAAVGAVDLSSFSVAHTPVAELVVNVATPVAPDVNLEITLGDLDSAPHVGLDVLQSRLPTTSTLPQVQAPLGQNVTFTLSGYEPLTFLAPGNVPSPDGSIGSGGAGLPGYVFTSSSSGSNPVTGTLPDYYRDGNTLNGYTPAEPDTGNLPNVTLSQALQDALTAGPSALGPLLNKDVLRQNVRETLDLDPANVLDPDAWREISDQKGGNSLRTAVEGSLNVDVDLDLENVIDPELRDTLAAISTLGAYEGRDVFDAAGPMVNVGSDDGVVTLEMAKRPDIGAAIKERSQKYLEQELALKKQREDWINEQLVGMEEGPARDAMAKSLEKEAEKKFGPSYYERIDLMTEAQNQRLYQELFPPEESGSGIWGSIIGAVIGIIVGIFTLGIGLVASMAIAAATSFVTTTATALISGAELGDALVAGLISGVIAGVTAGLTYGIMQIPGLNNIGQTVGNAVGGTAGKIAGAFVDAGTRAFVGNLVNAGINKVVYGRTGSGVLRNALTSAALAGLMAAGAMTIGHAINWEGMGPEISTGGNTSASLGEVILKPIIHGTIQGGVQELFGGDFTSGFAAGVVSSGATPWVESLGMSPTVNSQILGLLGGVSSAATGGNYNTGSMIGNILYWYNAEGGGLVDDKKKKPPEMDLPQVVVGDYDLATKEQIAANNSNPANPWMDPNKNWWVLLPDSGGVEFFEAHPGGDGPGELFPTGRTVNYINWGSGGADTISYGGTSNGSGQTQNPGQGNQSPGLGGDTNWSGSGNNPNSIADSGWGTFDRWSQDAANDLAGGNLVSGNLKAAGLSLWEALSFGAASNAGKVQGLYEQGQITDGEFYQGLFIAGAQSGAKATVTLFPAAKVPGLLSGANALLTSAKIGAVYGAAEASVEVIGDRAMEDVLRLSSSRTFWGGTKYVATQTAIGFGSGLAFGGITKGLQKVREAWNKSVIPDGPFFLAPNAAPAPKVVDAGIEWGKGINGQGMPWENYLATQLPSGSRLPPNFKTFDFFDEVTGIATSAKNLGYGYSCKAGRPETSLHVIKIKY